MLLGQQNMRSVSETVLEIPGQLASMSMALVPHHPCQKLCVWCRVVIMGDNDRGLWQWATATTI